MIKSVNPQLVLRGTVVWIPQHPRPDGKMPDYFRVAVQGAERQPLVVCHDHKGVRPVISPTGLSVQFNPDEPVDLPNRRDKIVFVRASQNPDDEKSTLVIWWMWEEDYQHDGWANSAAENYIVEVDGANYPGTLYELVQRFPKGGLSPDELSGGNWKHILSTGKMVMVPDPRPDHDPFAGWHNESPALDNELQAA